MEPTNDNSIQTSADPSGNVTLSRGTRSVVVESEGSLGYTATAFIFPGQLSRGFSGIVYYKTQAGALRAGRKWLAK